MALQTPVAQLIEESRLTPALVARALGCSIRALHSPLAPPLEERLTLLQALVASAPGDTPEEKCSALLASSEGPSLYRSFAATAPSPQRIHYSVPVEERLGL